MADLRSHRCLLILDNAESIFVSGDQSGRYQPGYENYGQLFQQLGETAHQSCVLLTSREKPQEVAALEAENLPVRSWLLEALESLNRRSLIEKKSVSQNPVHFTFQPVVMEYVTIPLYKTYSKLFNHALFYHR
jgi:hypothetical protein